MKRKEERMKEANKGYIWGQGGQKLNFKFMKEIPLVPKREKWKETDQKERKKTIESRFTERKMILDK